MSDHRPNELTRRQALNVSLGTAATAMGGAVMNGALAAGTYAGGSETIKVP